ncbi:hypothetical protein D9611_011615 [Ephemerocybe angulata]|uniref:F-box domain-containing protein n=1 Tax=Ephemerocybe angulata TaxID=980116 RepID=A0A8H5AVC8_9AGAR|nr:hypothetical protein D9611_011615 [Tulosesus angulatus]
MELGLGSPIQTQPPLPLPGEDMESRETAIEETDQIDVDGRASLPEPSTVEARDGSLARPFESMPNEIVGSILEEAHNQYYRSLPPRASWSPSSSSYRIEDVSSQVCSLWRGLAQHLPMLWSKFYLSRTNTGSIPKGEYDRLNLYLMRSVDEDLDIVFDSSGLNEKEPVLMVMLDLIPPHLRRLRRFVLHSDETNFVLPFYKSLTGVSAPRLEHFDVSTGKDPNIIGGFHRLPRGWDPRILTEGPLSIKYLRLDSSSGAEFRPPLDHLVHFSLHRTVACREIFLSWVCLEQVFSLPFIETISLWGPVADRLFPSPPLRCIEAKRLKHLRIGDCMELPLFSYLFNCVSAPLLESITLAATPDFAYNVLAPPSPDSESHFLSLKSLYLVDVVVEDRDNWDVYFRHLALKTASITHLSISSTSTTPRDRRMDIVHFLESSFAEAPWPNVERADFNLTKAVDYPTSEELAWSSSRGWGKLSCVRFPSHSLPTNTPSGLAIEPLTQVLPDWPPNYDFPSPVLTNEFCVPVVPASSSP